MSSVSDVVYYGIVLRLTSAHENTKQKNSTLNSLHTKHIVSWLFILDESSPKLMNISHTKNIVKFTLDTLDFNENLNDDSEPNHYKLAQVIIFFELMKNFFIPIIL